MAAPTGCPARKRPAAVANHVVRPFLDPGPGRLRRRVKQADDRVADPVRFSLEVDPHANVVGARGVIRCRPMELPGRGRASSGPHAPGGRTGQHFVQRRKGVLLGESWYVVGK